MKYKLIKSEKYKILDENGIEFPVPPQPRYVRVTLFDEIPENQLPYNQWVLQFYNTLR